MERGKKGWKCFSCLGQSLPGDRYLRFPSMKYSVSASHSSCEWQRPALRGTSVSGVQAQVSLYASPVLGRLCYCVFALCSALSPCCVSSGPPWCLSSPMSTSLPATIALAQKVKILPLRSIPGTWTRVLLFGFTLQNAMCLSGENPPDCGNQMPCAEEPDPPGCPEGRGWGCICQRNWG